MELLTTSQAKKYLRILVPLFIAVLSCFVLAVKIPACEYVQASIESLNRSNNTVMTFTGATMSTSVAISALPGDFATPLANSLADMDKYAVFILIVIFVERLLLVEGIKLSFMYVIPASCGLHILSTVFHLHVLRRFALRLAALGLALVLVVPCSTHFTEAVGSDYLAYVDETILEANEGADKVNTIMASDDAETTLFDKLTDAFKTAVNSMTDLLEYFKNTVKKCLNSVAILVVQNFVTPVLTFWFFRWMFNELFKLSLPGIPVPPVRPGHRGRRDQADELLQADSSKEEAGS